MTKLFIGSLPFDTTEEQLVELFKPHGTVTKATIINNRDTGRSRGFGFVEMDNDAEAQAAIAALNGSSYGGRQIVVNIARPMEERSAGGGRSSYEGSRGAGSGRGGGGGGFRANRW